MYLGCISDCVSQSSNNNSAKKKAKQEEKQEKNENMLLVFSQSLNLLPSTKLHPIEIIR